ncbi:MAG: EF-hand domain-containing protein [Steroidobacteraceae bacterium]
MAINCQSTIAGAIIAAVLLATSSDARAEQPNSADSATKLKIGLSQTAQLLQLMDTDKNGKVSKQEFMRFMEAEFDFADTDKNGELDPNELRRLIRRFSHPTSGPGR